MKEFLDHILPTIPPDQQEDFKEEVEYLISRTRKQLLGEVQTLLAAFNTVHQADLDLLRKEIDRIFLQER